MENMPTSPAEVTENVSVAPTVEEVKARIVEEANVLIAWVLSCQSLTFFAFETQLVPKVLMLGRLFIQLFLCFREEQFQATHAQPEPGYKRQGPKAPRPGCWAPSLGRSAIGARISIAKALGIIPWMWNWD